ncbi:hypothetical protein KHQ08_02835 [Pseudochrobactrum algeriensis]|uniref:hypothetical protein n=1 Tax=Pseudochrobactrum algeriensis TaxID=2834768 RepID=UPI001BCF645E|nr:hypothetical protein [Pseudochrobactrum algeriensis]MBX8813115.1 hypothetical protein [Ochrobactrum sp. MR34]QVQ37041.1 hypothetical protein KHQ08_02835 [Pseudochrobactrum algeriensis]QVQ40257.1 hypothetical protein KHQ07_01130 [Pseudochrobactrum algeriensis]QVQ44180.1 hypothetical protein KHQ09_03105 [Pseudochrobactrum algeriensis]
MQSNLMFIKVIFMKRFIIAIAALGMIAPVAAQAAPTANAPMAAQTQKSVAQKTMAAKIVKGKKAAASKTTQSTMKKTAPKQVKK